MQIYKTVSTLYYPKKSTCNLCYDEKNIVRHEISILQPCLCSKKVEFDLSHLENQCFDNIMRFDPYEGKLGAVSNVRFFVDCKEIKCIQKTNAHKNKDGHYLFLTGDPIFWIKLEKAIKLTVSFDVELYSEDQIKEILQPYVSHKPVLGKRKFGFVKDYINEVYRPCNNTDLALKDGKVKEPLLFVVWDTPKGGSTLLLINILKTIIEQTNYYPVVWLINNGPWTNRLLDYTDVYILVSGFSDASNRESIFLPILDKLLNNGLKNAILYNFLSCGYIDYLNDKAINTIVLVHEMPEVPKVWGYTVWVKNAMKNANHIVFPAEFVRDRFIAKYAGSKENCHVFRYGIYNKSKLLTFDEKKLKKKELAKELGIPENSKIVLGCGTDFHVKGVDLFVTTAVETIKKDNSIHFIWLGDLSKTYDNWAKVFFEMQLENAGVFANFHFIDFVDDPSLYFEATDVYFLSSRNDTFPSTVLEAFNSYCPVVMFKDASGSQDIVNNDNGAIVPYSDIRAASAAIFDILNSDSLREKKAVHGHETVKNLSIEAYVESICGLLIS